MNQLQMINRMLWGGGLDPDAKAFLDATAITDGTITMAINKLVIDLKSANIWAKFKAIYPFVGGTESTHKWNLIDARDDDSAFRLTFSGGIIHSSGGALYNGSTGTSDTHLIASFQLLLNSTHFSVYSRTNNQSPGYAIGENTSINRLQLRWFDNKANYAVNQLSTNPVSNSDSRGLFIANRLSSTIQSLTIRGNTYNASRNSLSLNTVSFKIGSLTNAGYDNKQIAFASIGYGLTSDELSTLNTAVNTYQTTLGRAV